MDLDDNVLKKFNKKSIAICDQKNFPNEIFIDFFTGVLYRFIMPVHMAILK